MDVSLVILCFKKVESWISSLNCVVVSLFLRLMRHLSGESICLCAAYISCIYICCIYRQKRTLILALMLPTLLILIMAVL